MVYGSGLENRQGASPRGFESHPLRQAQRAIGDERLVTGLPSIAQCGVRIADCAEPMHGKQRANHSQDGGKGDVG